MRKLLFISLIIFIISYRVFIKLDNNDEEVYNNVETQEKVEFESTDVEFDSTFIQSECNELDSNSNYIESNSSSVENKEDLVESNSSNKEVNKNVEQHSTLKDNKLTSEEEIIKEDNNNLWDDLGITEYDYYNKPMWSWARVDYSINDYGTVSATQQACIDAGNDMMDEILSYSCTSINSYSGKYLGEMLRLKY